MLVNTDVENVQVLIKEVNLCSNVEEKLDVKVRLTVFLMVF